MFNLALLIGIYSYIILGLGLAGILYQSHIVFISLIFGSMIFYFYRQKIKVNLFGYFKTLNKIQRIKPIHIKRNLLSIILICLLVSQAIVNLAGSLAPELGFDALWYHLTLPKIYLQNHSIFYIPGGLFYYSVMPKLTEMLYTAGLAFGNEIFAKLIHFSFGIASLIVLYGLSKRFLSKTFSLLVLVLFYSNLVVGWMSITAYVDLSRTFFEIMALWGFLQWNKTKKQKWLIISAILLGFAVSTKLLAIGSFLIFSLLITYVSFCAKEKVKTLSVRLFSYWIIGLFVVLPWFIFSYINTGNPIYPFFTDTYPIKPSFNLINPLNLSDPISPLYVIFLPIGLFLYRKFSFSAKILFLYSFFAGIIWYFTPQTGGGRFILPYLPAFSLITVIIIGMIRKIKLRYIFIWLIIMYSLFSILYRGAANAKYIPVILGKESKMQFLSKHLNFSFGDFYDIDGYFAQKIRNYDRVLLYGFHNLYYVNFPFVDSSYVKKGDMFNYVAVQGKNIPRRFRNWNLIYYNEETNVRLYSIGGLEWIY